MATDFIGFTIDGVHSSDLGLYRVSDGSRYNEDLLPTMKDTTVEVPGGDGTYYFGSYYTQRAISISVAYDSLTEQQIRDIRKIIGSRDIMELTFDEAPYKTYKVKSTGTSSLKYICFGDERIYKGEGTLTFTAYDPFAHCTKKWIEDYKYVKTTDEKVVAGKTYYYYDTSNGKYKNASLTSGNAFPSQYTQTSDLNYNIYKTYYTDEKGTVSTDTSFKTGTIYYEKTDTYYEVATSNLNEWKIAAGLTYKDVVNANSSSQMRYDIYKKNDDNYYWFNIYNPGDLETDWILTTTPVTEGSWKIYINFTSNNKTTRLGELDLSGFTLITNTNNATTTDVKIVFDSKRHIIEGVNIYGNRTNHLYNQYITGGAWFKLPLNEGADVDFVINNGGSVSPTLEYDYLYF